MGVFLCNLGCVMTRSEGENLTKRVRYAEHEMAKLQRVRHEIEVLLNGHVKELINRVGRLESQLGNMGEALVEGTKKSADLLSDLELLRGQLEEAQHRYQLLEQDQKDLLKNQMALSKAQKKIPIPPLKKDHFELAKKLLQAKKIDEALYMFEEFTRIYEKDREYLGQSYFHLGDIYWQLSGQEKEFSNKENYQKKSVIAFQKTLEKKPSPSLEADTLYKVGLVLKALGNQDASLEAFNELILKHKNSKHLPEAKKQIADLKAVLKS